VTARGRGRRIVRFKAAEVEAFGGGPCPAAVAGLGDAALYRDFQKVKGGALLVRRGTVVFTFSGSVSRDAMIALARLVAGRL
jgi:hypothetical protein